MTTATLDSSPAVASEQLLPSDLLNPVQDALAVCQAEPGNAAARVELARWRRAAVEAVAALDAAHKDGPEWEATCTLLELLRTPGNVTTADLLKAEALTLRGWPGLLAAMLLVPAHQWPQAPRFEEVPVWLWGRYAEWALAAAPHPTDQAQADRQAAAHLRRLEEISRLISVNLGSTAVRAVADAYLRSAALPVRYSSASTLRAQAELRGKILTRLLARGTVAFEPSVLPRTNRRLKIGVVRRNFTASAGTYAALARFEQLDAQQFETVLFSLGAESEPLADYCRRQTAGLQVLPAGTEAQVAVLRAATLDVLVFADSLTGAVDDLVRLATRRLAPLQASFSPTGETSGLPEIDLLLCAQATDASQCTERLGRLTGAATAYAFPRVASSEGEPVYDRSSLGLPADAPVYIAIGEAAAVGATSIQAWARVLSVVPTARFFLYVIPSRSTEAGASEQLSQQLTEALNRQGVAPDRATVYAPDFYAHADVRALLRVGSLYLAPLSSTETVWVAEALALGLPAVTEAGSPAADLLLEAGVKQGVAASPEAYVQSAVLLGQDESTRAELGRQITTRLEAGVGFLDTLAASEAFGALLQKAFDERVEWGADAFRAQHQPLQWLLDAPATEILATAETALERGDLALADEQTKRVLHADPQNPHARLMRGRILLAREQAGRAVHYLLAGIQQLPPDAGCWLHLAKALDRNGQRAEAIQALESALRLDDTHLDSWLMLLDVAEAAGATDLLNEATAILRKLAPEHPRLAAASF